MGKAIILLAGFAGGVLPYLLGMAHEAVAGAPAGDVYLYQNAGYWVGTLIFGVIGAAVPFFFGESNMRKALAMGAAAPGFVLGLGQGGAAKGSASADSAQRNVAVAEWLVGTAQAQQPTPQEASRQRGDTLWVRVLGVDSGAGMQTDLVAVGRQSPTRPGAVTYRLTPGTAMAAVPRSAASGLFLVVGGARTDTISISSVTRDTLTLRLGVRDRSFVSGLARTFGIRSVAAREPTVTVVGGQQARQAERHPQ